MTPAQQATAELHAAFWGIPYTTTLVAMHYVNEKLPRTTYNLMKQEAKELHALGMSRLSRADRRADTPKGSKR